jgi:hypothetical protein
MVRRWIIFNLSVLYELTPSLHLQSVKLLVTATIIVGGIAAQASRNTASLARNPVTFASNFPAAGTQTQCYVQFDTTECCTVLCVRL